LLAALDKLAKGSAVAVAQDDKQSTYASKIDKYEALIDWAEPAEIIGRRVRAFNPFPAAYSSIDDQRVKIWGAAVTKDKGQPGKILRADNNGMLVACGQGSLLLTEIQLAGKSRMPVAEILKSRADLFAAGKQLGQ
jgi:methionyl-tRNA formyltransferase